MAWPFSNVVAPNLDSGPGVELPTEAAAVATGQCWILGAHFKNTDSVGHTVTVTNTAGVVVYEVKIPAGGEQAYDPPFRPVVGVKWFASSDSVIGHLWGYK